MKKILITRNDPHSILDESLENCYFLGKRPKIIKSRFSKISSKIKLIRILIVIFASPYIILNAWKIYFSGHYFIIREFSNFPTLIISPFLWPLRKYFAFNINHNLSSLPKSFPLPISIMLYFGFRFILFDGQECVKFLPKQLLKNFKSPPFPCNPIKRNGINLNPDKPTISIVGEFRKEKGTLEQLTSIIEYILSSSVCQLNIGIYKNSADLTHYENKIKFVDTSTREDYLNLLLNSDAVIVFADPNKYYMRHSGTIMDIINCGAIPIAPNLPVLSSQLNYPTAVGRNYTSFEDLKRSIDELKYIAEFYKSNLSKYYRFRMNVELIG